MRVHDRLAPRRLGLANGDPAHDGTTTADCPALELIHPDVRYAFDGFAKQIAPGLEVRCDWGPQYVAAASINEVRWLGIAICQTHVGESECKGVAERYMHTL